MSSEAIEFIIFKFKMAFIWVVSLAVLLCLASPYASLLTMSNTSSASISNYYQDFASCSCDLTPSLCDNYCCCDSLCSSASTWTAANQCLTTSSSLEIPCGQSTRGFGSISDLACVYYSNRGTIGYYYQSFSSSSSSTLPSSTKFSSIKPSDPNVAQNTLLSSLSLGSSYTATNQYIKTSSTTYLYVPLPGVGGVCTPGLVNLTSSGTYTCKVVPTAENCASLNAPYVGTNFICLNSNCSSNSSSYTISSSAVSVSSGSSTCQNIITGFTLTGILGYSSGTYSLQSATVSTSNNSAATLKTEYTVSVSISLTTANTAKSGNPGYIQGKSIIMTGGIASIIDSSTGNCATSSSGASITIPFAVSKVLSCPSPSPCSSSNSSNYYIDTLGSLTLTINKYANQSTETITVGGNATMGCKAETYTLNILYSTNGWLLDPQYYVVSASMSATATPDGSNPTSKYLSIQWIYVDPSTVSTPPTNSFYTYFSYLWTPLKEKFGMS